MSRFSGDVDMTMDIENFGMAEQSQVLESRFHNESNK